LEIAVGVIDASNITPPQTEWIQDQTVSPKEREQAQSGIILEEQYRHEMITKQIPILKGLMKELTRRYPGYELIFRAETDQWVLYKVKHKSAGKSDDLLFKQFALPPGVTPGMWFIEYMQERDKGNENFAKWWTKVRETYQVLALERLKRDHALKEDMLKDFDAYKLRQKLGLHVHRKNQETLKTDLGKTGQIARDILEYSP
jgi:hypothetical protein